MSSGQPRAPRTLIVLADGIQAAFAAGALAELGRSGARWSEVWGAGLGAQVEVLAALGEAEEAARRWQRQGELGCPLLQSRVAALRERLAEPTGVLLVPDPYTLDGWLDGGVLDEHLAPERADLPGRLAAAGVGAGVALADLEEGTVGWFAVGGRQAADAGFKFDTVMFPINFVEYYTKEFGKDVLALAREQGCGVLAIKPLSYVTWAKDMKKNREWWYRSVEEPAEVELAMRFALSQNPVVAGIPPSFFLDLLDKTLEAAKAFKPLDETAIARLKEMAANQGSIFKRERGLGSDESAALGAGLSRQPARVRVRAHGLSVRKAS